MLKADLFSSTILQHCFHHLISTYFLFWITFTAYFGFIIVTMPPKKKPKPAAPQVVKITYPSDKQHWGRNLPVEHGKFLQNSFLKCTVINPVIFTKLKT